MIRLSCNNTKPEETGATLSGTALSYIAPSNSFDASTRRQVAVACVFCALMFCLTQAVRGGDANRSDAISLLSGFGRIDCDSDGRILAVSLVQAGDDVVCQLAAIPEIRELALRECQLGERTREAMRDIIGLRGLELMGCPGTDDFLSSLPIQTELATFVLEECHVAARSAMAIHNCSQVRHMLLFDVEIEDGWFSHLPDMNELITLSVIGVNITDSDVREMQRWPNLKSVVLNPDSPRLTDDIVPILASLTRLEEVWLNGTGITWTGRRILRTMRPDIHIVYSEKTKPAHVY